MKVTGFTIIRNAILFDYPVVESIRSALPVCDNFIVAVGKSEDDTLQLIQSIKSEKIKIIKTEWDLSKRSGGSLLADETNKAFDAIDEDSDWCFYIQSDEVLHEKYHATVRRAMRSYQDNKKVDGLLLNYLHFYGSYDYVGDSRTWYRKEIRIIKNNKNIRSYKDAQGFRTVKDKKLKVKQVNATMYHYGWVKPPDKQLKKLENFHKMWHNDEGVKKRIGNAETFDYSNIDFLKVFEGTHPKAMEARIKQKNWHFEHDISSKTFSLKTRFLYWFEKKTGIRIGEYKNYTLLK